MTPLYHFSRISGMKKKNDEGGHDFWSEHYQYHGKVFKINPQTQVSIVLCDNCSENHACNITNCELVCNQQGQIQTIYLVNVDKDKVIWIQNRQTIGECYYNYDSILYGNDKVISETDCFANVTQSQEMENGINKICIFSSIQSPLLNIHCDSNNKQILCMLSYGWNFFCICQPFGKFNFYSTSDNNLIPVHNSNSNIQYYILSKEKTPVSLFFLKYFKHCPT